MSSSPKHLIIIGGSVGSLDPILSIIEPLHSRINAAVVIVKHTEPGSGKFLGSIVNRHSSLDVEYPAAGDVLTSGVVYIAPPGKVTGFSGRAEVGEVRFDITDAQPGATQQPNIDSCIISAALAYTDRCIAVVLSGYLDDGTLGAQFLATHRGITIAQDPQDASVAYMPQSVIDYDSPSYILEAEEIAEVLSDICLVGQWPNAPQSQSYRLSEL